MNNEQVSTRPLDVEDLIYKLQNEPHRLWASEISNDYVSCWIVSDYEKYEPYFMGRKDIYYLMDETSVLIFITAYMKEKNYNRLLQIQLGKTLWTRFCQFQKLLFYISYSRQNRIGIKDFLIFDFPHYDHLILRIKTELSGS